MNTFNFEWKPEYRGTWKCPVNGSEIWGTLKIGQSDIMLELMSKAGQEIEGYHLEYIIGQIDSLDDNNVLSVKLCNLSLVKKKMSVSGGFNTYKYVAEEVFVSPDIEALALPVKAVCFCSDNIGVWSSKYSKDNIKVRDNVRSVSLKYEQPEPYKCFEDDSLSVELYYSFWRKTPDHQGYSLRTKCFLDVIFKDAEDFYTARSKALRISNLFSLITLRPIDVGCIIYTTENESYIHRNAFRYKNTINIKTPFTANNFAHCTPEVLQDLISKWCSYYNVYTNSLDAFFEIWNHELLPSEQRFKGYMSVLDGLTSDISVEYEDKLTKKEIIVKQYWPTFKERLKQCVGVSVKDLHKFDMAINGKKKKQDIPLEKRFIELLQILESILPRNIDTAFVKKCVRTRHKLTHPESKYKDVFSPFQYPKAILNLKTILCAYMLSCIGMKKDLIKQTLRMYDNT